MKQEKMTAMLEELISQNRISGAGLIVRKNGKEVYHQCLGYADIEKQVPVKDDTVYRIASMSKLLVAVAIMMLVEEGAVSLEDDLLKFFPQYPEEKRQVQVRHLLNHSSALGQSEISNHYAESVWDIRDSLKERVDKWDKMPLDGAVGESAAYSAVVNYDILGRIIEVVSGKSLETFLQEKIWEPLGMRDTTFFPTEEQLQRKAAIYESIDGKLIRQDENVPFIQMVSSEYGCCCGSAGIFSTLQDYDRFTTMLVNGGKWGNIRIIKEETLNMMITPRQVTNAEPIPGCPWGLGFMVFEHPEKGNIPVADGTFGWSGTFGTHMFVHRELGISATFMVSMGDLNGADSFISRNIERIVFDFAEKISGKSRPSEIRGLSEYAKYLMYKCTMKDMPAVNLTLDEMHEEQPSWNVESMVQGLKRLVDVAEKQNVLFDVYKTDECTDDPEKEDVKLWFLPAMGKRTDKPFILSISGGAYTCVCSLVESFPTAARFNELGYPVFVLTYRVMKDKLFPKPLEDIAAAIQYIQRNRDLFGLKNDEYIVNGYSAGANATVLWGTEEKGYRKYGLPRPEILFPIYPCISSQYQALQGKDWFLSRMFGHEYNMKTVEEYDLPNIFTDQYPPCYIVHAKDDSVVSSENSVQLKRLLDQHHIKAELELVEHGNHGFGEGVGTDAQGWIDRAAAFAEHI